MVILSVGHMGSFEVKNNIALTVTEKLLDSTRGEHGIEMYTTITLVDQQSVSYKLYR